MEDRFKFRVWDKINKKMWYEITDAFLMQFSSTLNDALIKIYNHDKLDLMQCTGFKDKNGTLIYEGDILYREGTAFDTSMTNYVFVNDITKSFQTGDHTLFNSLKANDREIIGNIYENPDLLKK